MKYSIFSTKAPLNLWVPGHFSLGLIHCNSRSDLVIEPVTLCVIIIPLGNCYYTWGYSVLCAIHKILAAAQLGMKYLPLLYTETP